MLRKILIAIGVLALAGAAVLYVVARSVLTGETVRAAVEGQLSKALGQPVHVGAVAVTALPRVTVRLEDVSIGAPGQIAIGTIDVGTDVRALLSRRIEHATARVSAARIVLPLPAFAVGTGGGTRAPASPPPVELVSIDQILLQQIDVVSGGRTLKADLDLVPEAGGVLVRRVAIGADRATLDVTGRLTDLAGPSGELTVKTDRLDLLEVVDFITAFTGGAALASGPASAAGPVPPAKIDLTVNVEAGRVLMGGLSLDTLSGRARITPEAVTLEPIAFDIFGGRYAGTLALTPAATPAFRLRASLSAVDMAKAMAFAGLPDKVTGRLTGAVDLAGRGTSADAVIRTVQGTARVDLTDGTVKGLGLLRSVIVATSMRADAGGASADPTAAEHFSRLGATLRLADGSAQTDDLRFVSNDLLLSAQGRIHLDGSAVDLAGPVQLSDSLSKQAGRDLVRYTQQDGRVTLPAAVSGPASDLHVRIDLADLTKRAMQNRATEEAGKAIKKGLGGLLNKK